MSTGFNPERRIPRNVGTHDTLLLGLSPIDTATILMPTMAMAYIGVSLPDYLSFLTLPLIAGGGMASLIIYIATPRHLTPYEWLTGLFHEIQKPEEIMHVSLATAEIPDEEFPETRIYEMNSTTQNELHVKRVHKDGGAIERPDGTVVGALKIDGINMAQASSQKWENIVRQWQGFLDNTLDHSIQIYATTRPFPVADYIGEYYQRLDAPDIKERPVLREVLADFINWYPEYIGWQGTFQREYYLVVTVEPDGIRTYNRDEGSIMDTLSDLAVVGRVFDKFTDDNELTDDERLAEQLKILNKRLDVIRRSGLRKLEGCSARRLTGGEFAVVLKEYWANTNYDLPGDSSIRDSPVLEKGGDPIEPDELMNDLD